MKLIKVAAGVLNQTPLDWERNKQHIIDAIGEARKQNISLLCLPELCITGYGCEDAFYSHGTFDMSLRVLQEVVKHTENIIVSVGLPIKYLNRIYNAACLIANKQILGFSAKRYLAGDGIHYEPRWFNPWPQGVQGEITVGEKNYPVGDVYYDCGGIKIGFEICEDAWVASRPGRDLYRHGVDIILNPSASHFAFGKMEIRRRFVLEGSRAFGVGYIYANLLGNEAGRAVYDGSTLIASGGKMLTYGKRFSYRDYDLIAAVLDVDLNRLSQAQTKAQFTSATGSQIAGETDGVVYQDFKFPFIKPEPATLAQEAWEVSSYLKEEEFARAVSLALFDYMRKSRSRGFVISLSGGADSSAVSALCYLSIHFALESIGLDAFKQKLDYIPGIKDCQTISDIAGKLITCIYQSTVNSSDDTRDSAEILAKDLHVTYFEISIDALVKQYVGLIENGIGRNLSWQTDDIALQNIQARVRSPSVWMLANLNNALLLSTSNRSEAAVGYATMDGDTSGSISPIAGIDKAFLRKWLVWLEKEGLAGTLKIKGLQKVNSLQPSAELRPLEMTQTDEADLMPYEVLDAIEKCAIRDKQTPKEVLLIMQARFGQIYTNDQLHLYVERFFRLWCRNQWKRERYAPSFHLDDENLDPKTWCRFPILSGGFEQELQEMRQLK
ncbi:NAD(+) synthase [Rhodocytophaga rosea]|uniref:Glutamine-dependent NAD(+) synthetase n=1 Tax=Rhodocytophaga rosea TaxID=2704465 RepID=A0A6C0GUZ8_9BACT|nr:NAD(+) synthase [Rhodocytophaga rosea]QHT71383.1 NAD(+) synthase [Rhodocytophaga rosea]